MYSLFLRLPLVLLLANSAFAQIVSKEYDSLAAKGDTAALGGKFPEALRQYQLASKIKLFEIPNVYLLPKMAIAAKRSGNAQLAAKYLERSKLIAEIQFGFLECTPDKNQLTDKNRKAIESQEKLWVVAAFCGVGYEYLYDRSNLDGYVWPAIFLVDYDKAKQIVLGKQ